LKQWLEGNGELIFEYLSLRVTFGEAGITFGCRHAGRSSPKAFCAAVDEKRYFATLIIFLSNVANFCFNQETKRKA